MSEFKFLRELYPGIFLLDHRLTPEVRAMLCAMSSRMPAGGIVARYVQVVDAVAQQLYDDWVPGVSEGAGGDKIPWDHIPGIVAHHGECRIGDVRDQIFGQAEDRLCEYPIPDSVQGFFDQFVSKYGHASIMELTGSPSVYIEGISWYAAYLSFDSPLCSGQEFSTRAVRHKDWPMARECVEVLPWSDEIEAGYQARIDAAMTITEAEDAKVFLTLGKIAGEERRPIAAFKSLHDQWFDVFEAEVEAWKNHLSDPAVREELGIADKEPFRPALDRARWAIPGTIATGCSHTGNLRERARTIKDALSVVGHSGGQTVQLWRDIRKAYDESLPGMGGMGLREALYEEKTFHVPGHLTPKIVQKGLEVLVRLDMTGRSLDFERVKPFKRPMGEKMYVDPFFNAFGQVTISFRCSLAVSRDWHRHRTAYPWRLNIVEDEGGIMLHPAYEPLSQEGNASTDALLEESTEIFHQYYDEGDTYRAMLALPLGTLVEMEGTMGLRDAIYMLELRSQVHGANFEYKAQATKALERLRSHIGSWNPALLEHLGLEPVDPA